LTGFTIDPLNPLDSRRQLERTPPGAGEIELKRGDRVRLRPRPGAEMMDLVLAGKLARIVAIEQDDEDRVHVAVTLDDDTDGSGRIAHRFFFEVDEVELV
jgi:hypothetical protein